QPYARLGRVSSDQSRRQPGQARANTERQFSEIASGGPVAVLSGATGLAHATREEHDLLTALIDAGRVSTVRATANLIGSGIEATFPAQVALGALALSRKGFYRPYDETGFEQPETGVPDRIAATTWGIWRGEGPGLIEAIG